jgi:hypothetical protein
VIGGQFLTTEDNNVADAKHIGTQINPMTLIRNQFVAGKVLVFIL